MLSTRMLELCRPLDENKPIGVDVLQQSGIFSSYYTGEDEDETDIADFLSTPERWRGPELVPNSIEIPLERCAELWMPWRRALIVKLLGRNVSYKVLNQRLTALCCKHGEIQIIDLDQGYYVVRFTHKDDYEWALMNGPWVIQGHYLAVSKWRPFFIHDNEKITSTLIWIRIRKIPHEMFKEEILKDFAKEIGKPIKVDLYTQISTRARFARICIEVDFNRILQAYVVMNGWKLKIEYEGLQMICFECGRFGHKGPDFPWTKENSNNEHQMNSQEPQGTSNRPYSGESIRAMDDRSEQA